MLNPRLHGRQFLLGPRPMQPCEGWKAVELGPGLFLSHDPELPLRHTGGRALIGTAVETTAGGPPPGTGEGASDTEGWSGRWALVEDGRLRLDATGTLACAHRMIGSEVWASSSPVLLGQLDPALARAETPIAHGRGMDWYPPPSSGIDGVAWLLPSQALQLDDGRVAALPLPAPAPTDDYAAQLAALERRLVSAVTGLGDVSGDVWVPLTGGRDSRLVLAATLAAGLGVRTYTLDHRDIDRADRELPPQIARACGIEHRFVKASRTDSRRLELWDRHTAGQAVDADAGFFAAGQLEHLAGAGVELYSNVLEVGRGYYKAALPADLPPTPAETAAVVDRELPSARPEGVLAWAQWLHATHDARWDWRERFYVEQRLAGWLGAIGQGIDLTGIPRVHPANCAAYLADTLGIVPSIRESGRHQDDLTERLSPSLAGFPVNPPSGLAERLRARGRREAAELKTHGSPARYVRQRVRRWRGKRAAGSF